MITRQMQREIDDEQLINFDFSFSTKRIYRIAIDKMEIEITEEILNSPFHKSYQPDFIKKDINEADYAIVSENENVIAGFATVKFEDWNNRAVLTGIFVASEFRGKGVGKTLIESVEDYAKTKSVRCLFVETQNVNYPAIQFYRRMKFEFCGFDTSLYNPADVSASETAFYFCKPLSK